MNRDWEETRRMIHDCVEGLEEALSNAYIPCQSQFNGGVISLARFSNDLGMLSVEYKHAYA